MAGLSTRWMGALSRSRSASAWAPRALLLVMLATVTAVIAGACSGDDGTLPGPHGGVGGAVTAGGTGAGSSSSAGDSCVEGEELSCHITIGEHDGVLTCLDGVRRCEGGTWGGCTGTTTMRRSPFQADPQQGEGENAYPQPFSNSDAGPCVGNPCDPSCQSFDEAPDGGGITLPAIGPMYPWTVGDINTLPADIVEQGIHRPCTTAEDCQFDQYCDNPARGSCTHDACAPGTALLSSCNSCVTKICNSNPTCCLTTAAPNSCLHDPCLSGSALNPTCGDPCVAAICAARPGCCTNMCSTNADCQALVGPTSTCSASFRCTCAGGLTCPLGSSCNAANQCNPFWGGANCVNQVGPVCGKSCGPPPVWTATCANLVGTSCGASCETDPGCTHDKCYTGAPLIASCDPCVTQICANPAYASCCSGGPAPTGWTDACVAAVATVCSPAQTCPQHGVCTSYTPNETNACATADLTLGVPCGGTIPVCNRGNTAAPAGVRIFAYPPSAGQLPSSAPNKVLNSCNPVGGTLACTTVQTIAPGQCISVAGCAAAPDSELVVNPPGAGHVVECQCANNGSVYHNAACQSPGCIATASVSLIKQVSMFVAFDVSGSMVRTDGFGFDDKLALRWVPATNALKTFFSDPASSGLGVALRFWPDNNPAPCDTTPCQPTGPTNGCAIPRVPRGILTADSAPTDTQEATLNAAINGMTANGETPMYPALDGATHWAIQRKLAFPDEEVSVVLVTDGIPNGCGTDANSIANLAYNAFYNYGVRVHAIGFGGANPTFIQLLADRGGGQYYTFPEGVALEQNLLSALGSVRGEALPCDVSVPVEGVANPNQVSVLFVDTMGTETTLTKRADAASCAPTGWYFDPTNPSIVKLCPQTCTDIRASTGGRVQAVVPCISTYAPTYTNWERYHGVCPSGTKVQWGYLTYDTTAPDDSTVQFLVRAGNTPADADAAMETLAATARSTPTDSQVCDISGLPPCSVDLYTTLGGPPEVRHDYLDVRMRLDPSTAGDSAPTIHNWEITYSCVDSE